MEFFRQLLPHKKKIDKVDQFYNQKIWGGFARFWFLHNFPENWKNISYIQIDRKPFKEHQGIFSDFSNEPFSQERALNTDAISLKTESNFFK